MRTNKKNDITQKQVDVLIDTVMKLKRFQLTEGEIEVVTGYFSGLDYNALVAYFDSKVTKNKREDNDVVATDTVATLIKED